MSNVFVLLNKSNAQSVRRVQNRIANAIKSPGSANVDMTTACEKLPMRDLYFATIYATGSTARTAAIPARTLMDIVFHEDSQTCSRSIVRGRPPTVERKIPSDAQSPIASNGAPMESRVTTVVKINAGFLHLLKSYSSGSPITASSVLNVNREKIRSDRTMTPARRSRIRLKAKATD